MTTLTPVERAFSLKDSSSSNGQSIRFVPPSSVGLGGSAPLVIYSHPNAFTQAVGPGDATNAVMWPQAQAAIDAGCIFAATNGHGNNWGNNNVLADTLDLYGYVTARYTVPKVMLVGDSMGALVSALLLAAGSIPNIKGLYTVDGVFSLSALYAGAFTSTIDTAYGITRGTLSGATSVSDTSLPTTASFPTIGTQLLIGNGTANVETVTTTGASSGTAVAVTATTQTHLSGAQVADYPTKTVGHDPLLMAASAFGTIRKRFVAASGDATVGKAANTDAFAALVASLSLESAIVTSFVSGTHLDASHFHGRDLYDFLVRCLAD